MIYCLDTNVIVRALRGKAAATEKRLRALQPEQIKISEMVRAELLTGARKSARPLENEDLVNQFLAPFALLPFSGDSVDHYADIRIRLERSGTLIGPNDLIIAASARSVAATLITANLGEFKRVPGLQCEDWV
jgi:tRNA(fMet)-specific endonuclease VapC